MADLGIPRHPRRRPRSTTWGRFVEYGDTVKLTDRWGNLWSVESVTLMMGSFGFDDDGFEKVPRPWKYDDTGKVVVTGDMLIVDFLDGNPKAPVVRGGARRAAADDFLARNHKDIDAPYNRMRARLRALDKDGNIKGEVRLRVNENERGELQVEATHQIRLFVGKKLDQLNGMVFTIVDGVAYATGGESTASAKKLVTEDLLPDLKNKTTEDMQLYGALAAIGIVIPPANNTVLSGKLPTSYRTTKLESE